MSGFPVSPHFSHDLLNAERRLLLPGFFDNSLGVSCWSENRARPALSCRI